MQNKIIVVAIISLLLGGIIGFLTSRALFPDQPITLADRYLLVSGDNTVFVKYDRLFGQSWKTYGKSDVWVEMRDVATNETSQASPDNYEKYRAPER